MSTPRTDANETEAITGLGRCVGVNFARQLEAELAAANARIKDLEARGIHSCHDGCQRVECVQRRRIDELLAACEAASEYFGASLHPVASRLRAAIAKAKGAT